MLCKNWLYLQDWRRNVRNCYRCLCAWWKNAIHSQQILGTAFPSFLADYATAIRYFSISHTHTSAPTVWEWWYRKVNVLTKLLKLISSGMCYFIKLISIIFRMFAFNFFFHETVPIFSKVLSFWCCMSKKDLSIKSFNEIYWHFFPLANIAVTKN